LQMSQMENIFTNFPYNQIIPQNNEIFLTHKSLQGSLKTRKNILSPNERQKNLFFDYNIKKQESIFK